MTPWEHCHESLVNFKNECGNTDAHLLWETCKVVFAKIGGNYVTSSCKYHNKRYSPPVTLNFNIFSGG